MNGRYRLIDEVNFNLLGTFDSREEALDCVAALLAVNDADYLQELTIANDEGARLTGESLRAALERRVKTRGRVGASSAGGSNGSGDSGHGYGALAAKGCE